MLSSEVSTAQAVITDNNKTQDPNLPSGKCTKSVQNLPVETGNGLVAIDAKHQNSDLIQMVPEHDSYTKVIPGSNYSESDKRFEKGGLFYGFSPTDEILEQRADIHKYFLKGDDQRLNERRTSPRAIHYRDETGAWQDIVTDIGFNQDVNHNVLNKYAYSNKTNSYHTYLPDKPGNTGYLMIFGGQYHKKWVNPSAGIHYNGSFSQENLLLTQGEIQKNSIIYNNMFPGVLCSVTVESERVAMQYVFTQLPEWVAEAPEGSAVEFSETIVFPENWSVYRGGDKMATAFSAESFAIIDESSGNGYYIYPMVAKDASCSDLSFSNLNAVNGSGFIKAHYFVEFVPEGIRVHVRFDAEWMKQQQRAYPVTVCNVYNDLIAGGSTYWNQIMEKWDEAKTIQYVLNGINPGEEILEQFNLQGMSVFQLTARLEVLKAEALSIAAEVYQNNINLCMGTNAFDYFEVSVPAHIRFALSTPATRQLESSPKVYDCPGTCSTWDGSFNVGAGSWGALYSSDLSYGPCRLPYNYHTNGYQYSYSCCDNGASASFDSDFAMYQESGCVYQWYVDGGCASYRAKYGPWSCPFTGFADLMIDDYYGGTGSSYTFSFTAMYAASASCVSCPSYDFSIWPSSSYQTSSSSIVAGGCKMYEVYMYAGTEYVFTFCEGGGSANYDTYLKLYNSSCTQVAANDDYCGIYSQISYTPSTSGYHYLEVNSCCTGGSGGNYTLAYRYVPGVCTSCPNYTSALYPSASYQTASGSFAIGGCTRYYVYMYEGTPYRFSFCEGGGTASFDTYLRLYDASCNVVLNNDDYCGILSQFDYTPSTTGVYYVEVNSCCTGGSGGTYTLAYKYTPGTCTACPSYDSQITPTAAYQTISSSFAIGGCTRYRVDMTQGLSYRFSFCEGGGTAGFDTYLRLYNSSCSNVVSNDDYCSLLSQIDYTAPSTGTYYIEVNSCCTGGSGGAYTLAYRGMPPANDNCANAINIASLPYTSPVANTSFATDDVPVSTCDGPYKNIWYVISGVCGSITANTCSGTNFDTEIAVFTGSCGSLTHVACNDDACGIYSSVTWNAVASNTYYISVGSYYSAGPTGSLTLNVTTAGDVSAPVYVGTTITGANYVSGNTYFVKSGTTFYTNVSHSDNCASNFQYLEFTYGAVGNFGSWDVASGNIKSYANPYGVSSGGTFSSYSEGLTDDQYLNIQTVTCQSPGNCSLDVLGRWQVTAGSGVSRWYHVTVYMYDQTWNGVGYTDTGLDVYLDNTSPSTPGTPVCASGSGTVNQTWTISACTDGQSGINASGYEWQWSYDNSTWNSWFTGGTSGSGTWECGRTLYIRVRANDNVANAGAWSASGSSVTDNVAPTYVGYSNISGYAYQESSTVFWVKGGNDFKIDITHSDNCKVYRQYFSFNQNDCNPNGCGGPPAEIKSSSAYGSSLSDWMVYDTHIDINGVSCVDGDGNCTDNDLTLRWNSNIKTTCPDNDYKLHTFLYDVLNNGVGYTDLGVWVKVDNTAPTHDTISVNENCWSTDGTNTYTITIVSTEPRSGFGGTYGMMALVNYHLGSSAAGGYFAWHPTSYVHTENQMACTGGGYVSKSSTWGGSRITLVSATTSVVGNQRTVVFTVRPHADYLERVGDNKISMYTSDNCNNYRGWTLFNPDFTTIRVPATPTGATTICLGSSATLTRGNAPPAGVTYYWQTSPTGTSTSIGSGATLIVSPTTTTTYYVRPYSTSGCWGTASVGVTVEVGYPATVNLSAGDYVWYGASSTAWNTLTNWLVYDGSSYFVPSALPGASNNVFVKTNTCTSNDPVISSAISVNNLTIESGKTLTISGSNVLTIYGNYSNAGTFVKNTSTVVLAGGDANINSGGVTVGTHDFYNLELNASGIKTVLTNEIRVSNNYIMTSGTLNMGTTLILNVYGQTITLNGGTISGTKTSQQLYIQGTNDKTITGTGANVFVYVRTGNCNLTIASGCVMNMNNNFHWYGSSKTAAINGQITAASNGTFYVRGSNCILTTTNPGICLHNLDFYTTGNFTIGSPISISGYLRNYSTGVMLLGGNEVNVGTNFTNNNAAGIVDISNCTLRIKGNYTNTGTIISILSTVEFNGTGTQTINSGGVGASKAFYDVVINKPSGTATVSTNSIEIGNDFSILSGTCAISSSLTMFLHGSWTHTAGVFTCNTSTVSFDDFQSDILSTSGSTRAFYHVIVNSPVFMNSSIDINGDITINPGHSLTTNNFNITVARSWTNNGTFTPGTGTVTFDGSATPVAINTGGTGAGKSFYNLTVNKGAAAQVVNIATNDIDVNNNLAFTRGSVNGNNRDIYLASNYTCHTSNGTFYPGAGTLILDGSGNQTINSGGVGAGKAVNNLLVNKSGGTASISSYSLDVDGNVDISAGTLAVSSSLGMIVAGNWNHTGGSFTCNTSTVTFDGAASAITSTSPGIKTFYNVIVADNSSLGSDIDIDGNITINNACNLAAGAFSMSVARDWINNGSFSAGSGSTVTFDGMVSAQITGSSSTTFFRIALNKGTALALDLAIICPVTISNTSTTALTLTNGLLRINSGGVLNLPNAAQTITATSGIEVTNGIINGGNATLNNDGFFRLNSGTVNIGTAAGNSWQNRSNSVFVVSGGTMNIAGRLMFTAANTLASITGGTINLCTVGNTATTGSFNMVATAGITISGNPVINFVNPNTNASPVDLNILSGSGVKSIEGGTFRFGTAATPASAVFRVNSAVPVYDVAISGVNNPTLMLLADLQGSRNLTIDAGGTLSANNHNWNLSGTWDNKGSYIPGIGKVMFNGSTPQSIYAGASSFNGVIFNNTSPGSADIAIYEPMIINGDADFENGVAYFSGTGSMSFGSAATSNYGSVSSYVDGPVAKTGTSSFIFPTGEGSVWAPIGVAAPVLNSTITAEYNFAPGPLNWTAAYMCDESQMHHTSGIEHWELTTTNSTPAVTIFWFDAARSGITSLSDLAVAHWSGDCWEYMGGTVAGSLAQGSITSTLAFSSYSPVSFGSKNNINPLPVELVSFTGDCSGKGVELQWQTATETNNRYFVLERSADAVVYNTIASIEGAGNSTTPITYNFIDRAPVNGIGYYRLKQVDIDGTGKYYNAISVVCEGVDTETNNLSVYPNPFRDEFVLKGQGYEDGNALIRVCDALGKEYMVIDSPVENGALHAVFDGSSLPPAVYFVHVKTAESSRTLKIVKH